MYFIWTVADVIILIGRFGKHIKGYYKVHSIYMTFAQIISYILIVVQIYASKSHFVFEI